MLERFVSAQDTTYQQALTELREGHKQSHWIWFIFPQIAGLGHSEMARRYAIRDLDEARAYLAHPVLSARLSETSSTLLSWQGKRSAEAVLGSIDAMKVRSSMTLFEAAGGNDPFASVLAGFYDGERDERTLALLT